MKYPTSEVSGSPLSSKSSLESAPSNFWKTIRTNVKRQHQAPPIERLPYSENLPLSFAQERLWLLDRLQPGSAVHNMRAAFRLTGSLNVAALEQSLQEIERRHEILRTTFSIVENQPIQSISPNVTVKLPVIDLHDLAKPQQELETRRLLTQESEQSFDLIQGPLWQVKLLHLTQQDHILIRTVHHTIFDGWSYSLFMRELAALYEAFSAGKPSPLPELPIQYADYARSQRQWLQGEVLDSQLNYWQQQLSGNVAALQLPVDRLAPLVPTYRGANQTLVLPKNLTEALRAFSSQEGVSLFIPLLTAFKVLLHRYSRQEDMVVCSPVAGRHQLETKRLIGYFNNMILLRTDLSGNPGFRELAGRVSQVTLGAYEHQDLPFQNLADLPDLVRVPLSRAMFAMQNLPSQPTEFAGITVSSLDVEWETVNFDLSLSIYETGETLTGVLLYKTDLFDAATIAQLLDRFQSLLDILVANPDQPLSSLPCFATAELSQSSIAADPQIEVSTQFAASQADLKQVRSSTFIAPRDELERQMARIWESVLQIQSIGVKDNFFELGGHSLLAVRLSAQIEKTLGKALSFGTLFQSPTIEQLANTFRHPGTSTPWSCLVPIHPQGSQPPLFFIHVLGRGLKFCRPVAHYLNSDQPVYGLAVQVIDPQYAPPNRVEDLAAYYIRELRAFQPEGPYYLIGMSFGGKIAFEMAHQLQAQGQSVALLALIDTYGPNAIQQLPAQARISAHWNHTLKLGLPYLLKKIIEKGKGELDRLVNRLSDDLKRIYCNVSLRLGYPLPESIEDYGFQQQNAEASNSYIPQVYSGRLTLFRALDQRLGVSDVLDPYLGWGDLAAKGVDVYEVPGNHLSMVQEPHAGVLAQDLKQAIEKAKQEAGITDEYPNTSYSSSKLSWREFRT
jgi:thioesterase domain-containing protein/acyl carrier protein